MATSRLTTAEILLRISSPPEEPHNSQANATRSECIISDLLETSPEIKKTTVIRIENIGLEKHQMQNQFPHIETGKHTFMRIDRPWSENNFKTPEKSNRLYVYKDPETCIRKGNISSSKESTQFVDYKIQADFAEITEFPVNCSHDSLIQVFPV